MAQRNVKAVWVLTTLVLATSPLAFGDFKERLQQMRERTANKQQPPPPQPLAQFDGEWTNPSFLYSFRISGSSGTATVSNTPAFKPGDVILKISSFAGDTFQGTHMFGDGTWKPVTGKLAGAGVLQMQGGGISLTMVRAASAPAAASPPAGAAGQQPGLPQKLPTGQPRPAASQTVPAPPQAAQTARPIVSQARPGVVPAQPPASSPPVPASVPVR